MTSPLHFERPPVHELALSVQFAALEALSAAHAGALWTHFRETFPKLELHPPLPNVSERFGSEPQRLKFKLVVSPAGPPGRTWFVSQDGRQLVQVQQDRFVRNWRRLDDADEYPSFGAMRQRFVADFGTFQRGLAELGLGSVDFDQCELTYVDHAVPGEGYSGHRDLPRVVRGWSWPTLSEGIVPEQATGHSTYVLGQGPSPWGRAHVRFSPGLRPRAPRQVIVIETTARGAPQGAGLDGVLAFFDRAHEAVRELFLAVTTDDIQRAWGRRSE